MKKGIDVYNTFWEHQGTIDEIFYKSSSCLKLSTLYPTYTLSTKQNCIQLEIISSNDGFEWSTCNVFCEVFYNKYSYNYESSASKQSESQQLITFLSVIMTLIPYKDSNWMSIQHWPAVGEGCRGIAMA